MSALRHWLAPALLVAGLLVAGLWGLDATSPWWDEGWTLAVARTWVERGFYGRLLDGQPAPPGLEAAFPVTDMVALSLRLLGVGVWQGRLPIALCMLGALALMFQLADRLYSRRVAWATLGVLLLAPIHPQLHALALGRQVLAELPMLCYLLAGYLFFLQALRRSAGWLPLAMLFWGLGLLTKLQGVPFWALSLLAPLALALLQRRWRFAGLIGAGMLGAGVCVELLPLLQRWIVGGSAPEVVMVPGLVEVTAVVPVLSVRLAALQTTLVGGMPALLGLGYAAWRLLRQRLQIDSPEALLRCMLLLLAGSWLAWFAALSVGFVRYLFPALFVASLFVAALLADLTNGFDLAATGRQLRAALSARRLDRATIGTLLALALALVTLPRGLQVLEAIYAVAPERAAAETAAFLNSATPAGARIETYETELYFFLDRAYHYPPDRLHVALNRRTFLQQDIPIDYAPLTGAPDYIVIGSFGEMWGLYDMVPGSPSYRLIRSYGAYKIYERIPG